MPRLLALLALVLLVPGATAFASERGELRLAYDTGATPPVIGAGALDLEGVLTGGLIVGGAQGTVLARIPVLSIIDRTSGRPTETVVHDATLEFSAGSLAWTFPRGSTLFLDARAAYGIVLALPKAPLPTPDGTTPGTGFLALSEAVQGTGRLSARNSSTILPLDAVATLRDARGEPLPGWRERSLNAGASQADEASLDVLFRVDRGDFDVTLRAAVVGGATGNAAAIALRVAPAATDRYDATLAAAEEAGRDILGHDAGGARSLAEPLSTLQGGSGVLNGALLVVPGTGGDIPVATPTNARFAGEPFTLGALALFRGEDLALHWDAAEMRVAGTPHLALGREGFEVKEPARVGLFPIVSLLLWIVAAGALAWYFVRRPPAGTPETKLRLASLALYVVVLLVAFFVWDRSFAQSFGTSLLTLLFAGGVSLEALPRLGIVAALELAPWGIAGLFFALPVRIVAGVGLRYLGRGKSFKSAAKACGLVSLAIFGPAYALWCFNFIWRIAGERIGV